MEIGRVERLADSALERSEKFAKEGLTFDDVLLVPAESSVLPNDVATATRFTRTIALEIPLVSAAMDTVTEARTDRKSTRLNSSHVSISYAVFCLTKNSGTNPTKYFITG